MIEVVESELPHKNFIYVYADRVPVGMIEWKKKGNHGGRHSMVQVAVF